MHVIRALCSVLNIDKQGTAFGGHGSATPFIAMGLNLIHPLEQVDRALFLVE